jgi:hypothetical protein
MVRGRMLVVVVGLGLSTGAAQGNSATQVITIGVRQVTRISLSGNQIALQIEREGRQSATMTDATATYSLVSNARRVKIAGSISAPLPEGTTLEIQLESSRGTSVGMVDITRATTPRDLVVGIVPGVESAQRITYAFSVKSGVKDVAQQSRVVTLTITD